MREYDQLARAVRGENVAKMVNVDISNEKILFLFNIRHGLAPYSHTFARSYVDEQVLAGFVSAMLSFMTETTGTQQSHLRTEYGPDSTLIAEVGEWIVGVLIVNRVTSELQSKLRRIVKQFETDYAFLKDADTITGNIYEEFDRHVRREFVEERLSERSILLKEPNWVDKGRRSKIRPTTELVRLLTVADDGSTVGDVAKSLNISLEKAIEQVAQAVWYGLARVIYVPSDSDILSISEEAASMILGRGNPLGLCKDTVRVLALADGRKDFGTLMKNVNDKQRSTVLREIGVLLNRGCVQRVALERKIVLLMECVLSRILQSAAKQLGIYAKSYLTRAIREGIDSHPWLGRVTMDGDLNVRCQLGDSMSPTDLDDMRVALKFLQDVIQQYLINDLQDAAVEIILDAQHRCHTAWERFLNLAR